MRQKRTEQDWAKLLPDVTTRKFPKRLAHDVEKYKNKLPKIQSTYIYGPVGVGKTVVAAQMLLEKIKDAYINNLMVSAKLITTTEMINNIKWSFDSPDSSEAELVAYYSDVDYLVMDDMGMERVSDWLIGIMFQIINARYENMKFTIFTSNIPLEELSRRYNDDRIPGRIERMCNIVMKTKF